MPTNPYTNHNVRFRLTLPKDDDRIPRLAIRESVQEVNRALNTYAYTIGF